MMTLCTKYFSTSHHFNIQSSSCMYVTLSTAGQMIDTFNMSPICKRYELICATFLLAWLEAEKGNPLICTEWPVELLWSAPLLLAEPPPRPPPRPPPPRPPRPPLIPPPWPPPKSTWNRNSFCYLEIQTNSGSPIPIVWLERRVEVFHNSK